jgi:hypothetical protein
MRIVTRDFKMVIITSDDVKSRLIPDLQNFNVKNIVITNSKILKDSEFVDCVEIKLLSSMRVLNEIIKYLEDSYLGKFDISYYYYEANYY